MRLFTATLATETNTFSPLPTGLASYKESVFLRPGEHPDDAPRMCTAPLFVARRRASKDGFTLIEGSCFAASPAGTTNRADYETMRDEILAQLKAALPLDAVLLGLHGAMVAFGYDDVEGDIVERVRAIVGPKCIIGVELDPHCHLTLKRVRLADIIVLYKEFPHTDVVERAEDLLDLVLATLQRQDQAGDVALRLPPDPELPDDPAADARLRRSHQGAWRARTASCRSRSCTASPTPTCRSCRAGCWWWRMATRPRPMRSQPSSARRWCPCAARPCPSSSTPRAASRPALAFNAAPVVIAEPSDNAGGGAPSDNTSILRELIGRNADEVALGPIWDPVAVRLCFDAGLGATFPLRFGGKTGPASGQPVDATVDVIGLAEDCWQSFGPTKVPLGDCAAIRIGGVEVVLITKRTQALGLELFTNLGIDPRAKKVVVVKSTNHFMAAFGPIAKKVIYVDSDAPLCRDYRKIPYTRVQRPIWPLDEKTEPGLIF